ncbi:glycoside hydrolase family 97 protein [Alkaliflexus imshenetskii]|uniref:glycoside hydrolase family 97 protein n=1 Tax=Alkaliflexus imshenetskii TaxID=286730 RepID=UPI00047B216A|nr:glycoside hydrolase family 97 protein [Alkaliflexus imshenetskii]
MMKFLLSTLLFLWALGAWTQTLNVSSPDGRIRVNLKLTDRIYYNLEVDGQEVMWFSPVSMNTSRGLLGQSPKLVSSNITSVNETIQTVWGIRSQVQNSYNELKLDFNPSYSLLFRVYDDGVAYRFQTNFKGDLVVFDEEVEFRFWNNFRMINHVVDAFDTSYEEVNTRQNILDVTPSNLVSLPSIIDQENLKLAILESDVYNYPGMYLSKTLAHTWPYLNGKFPRYPLEWREGGHNRFNLKVTKTADYIAKTTGARSFPWRIVVVARQDVDLADSDMVYRLARPAKISTDWIKPGKVAWDWWNALNLKGVDFETGINNKTYEYFIDFAAANGIDYVIMDEGWSDQFDVLLPTPHVDMEHLTAYAKEKGVGLILWCVWHTIDRQYEEAFKLFHKWGVKGIKVDFIDRDDQLAIEFYERLVREAAKYQLLVNYHGCSKPTGLDRTYPNLITYEAVRGNEYNKFSNGPEPGHNVDLVFTRLMAGPMDYTPGAMRNSIQGDFHQRNDNPMSKGTRCHQLAMFVAYFSPLQMLCDAPTAYEQYPDILEFLSEVPVTWDETVVLDGKIGEYVLIARRKGEDWFIGGLNNWDERTVEVDLSRFLNGAYSAKMIKDGVNANRQAEDYLVERFDVDSHDRINIVMKMGGGFVLVLTKYNAMFIIQP